MSNISLIIEERAASIGNFLVGRLLPFRQKRMIGPFIFIDHMGPVHMKDYENFDVGPHPHIGLSTLTYLLEGSIMHKDSVGSAIEIKPGAVNWMNAGKGVVHSERTPDHLRQSDKVLHGLQIWVALPKEYESMDPSFFHFEAEHLPRWSIGCAQVKLIAGQAFGRSSLVPVLSPLYLIEIKTSSESQVMNIGEDLYGESGLYILEGGVITEDHDFGPKQILVANDSKLCSFTMKAHTTVYIFGGEKFEEDRYIDWNFVATDKSILKKAKEDWEQGLFPTIEGESDLVPYPIKKN